MMIGDDRLDLVLQAIAIAQRSCFIALASVWAGIGLRAIGMVVALKEDFLHEWKAGVAGECCDACHLG